MITYAAVQQFRRFIMPKAKTQNKAEASFDCENKMFDFVSEQTKLINNAVAANTAAMNAVVSTTQNNVELLQNCDVLDVKSVTNTFQSLLANQKSLQQEMIKTYFNS